MCVEEDSRGPLQLSRIGGRLPPWFPHKRSSPHKSFHPPPPTLSPAYNASDDENKGDHLLGVLVDYIMGGSTWLYAPPTKGPGFIEDSIL